MTSFEGGLSFLEFGPEGSKICVGTFKFSLFDRGLEICNRGNKIFEVEMDMGKSAQRLKGCWKESEGNFCINPSLVVFFKLCSR